MRTTVEPVRGIVDDAFRSFYAAEIDAQVRRATCLLRSAEAANDVVHDAMVEVYRRWTDLHDPAAYLNRAVLNGCRDIGRRRRTARRHQHQLEDRRVGETPQDPLEDLIDRLPFVQRAAVVLRYYEGWSHADIAAALGCAVGSVGPWIDRALKSLKGQLS